MSRTFRKGMLAFGLLGCLVILVTEKVRWNSLIFATDPRFSLICLLHTFLIILSVLCLLLALTPRTGSTQLGDIGQPGTWVRWGVAAVLFVSVGSVVLFLLEPGLFRQWAAEDSFVEWGSACFLFAGGAVIAGAAFRAPDLGTIRWTAFFLAGALWFTAMEEISWFQRVLNYTTPDALVGNHQGEVNLHNFASHEFEYLYYMGTFLLLVALPFLKDGLSWLPGFRHAERFIATPFVATVATLPCAFNYDMWNPFFTQGAFFACLGFLSLRGLDKWGREGKCAFGMVLLLVGVQAVFLTLGSSSACYIKEHKELLIAMLWWVYALDTSARIAPFERR